MRQGLGWVLLIVLCCAAGGARGEQTPDARLQEAEKAYQEASSLRNSGAYSQARARAEQALALWEAVRGDIHMDVADGASLVSQICILQGDLSHAEPMALRALSIKEQLLGKNHTKVGMMLNNLGLIYRDEGLYDRAEPLFQRALSIQEAAQGHDSPFVAIVLNNLGTLYKDEGFYDRAEPLFQRALSIQEVASGPEGTEVAREINNLALLYEEQGLYTQAEPLYQRALDMREKRLGKSHPDTALSLNNLASLYLDQGAYSQAEPLLQRALSIWEAVDSHHPRIALALTNLADLHRKQGSYVQAKLMLERALDLWEQSLGPRHPDVASALSTLADLEIEQGLYDDAEQHLVRVRSIRQEVLGLHHPLFAEALTSLAHVYAQQGLYGQAEPLLQQALSIHEARLNRNKPAVAGSLHHLATLEMNQGLYGQAEPLLLRALALHQEVFGENNPSAGPLLTRLAQVRLAQHRLSDALPLFTQAFALSERRLRQEALDFSESRLNTFLHRLREDEQTLYSLLRAEPGDAGVRRLALSAALLLKGRSLEETATISRTLYHHLDAQGLATFERLRARRAQLATLSLKSPADALTSSDYQARLQALTHEGDVLEADVARRSAHFRSLTALPPPEEIVERVAAALPPDAALIEFISYVDKPLVPELGVSPASQVPHPRYLALLLFPDASTRAVELGPAEPIDDAATHLRSLLANSHGAASSRDLSQRLYQLVFKPLRPVLGTTRRLLLSPDGPLNLVPFDALHDGQDYLLDSFDFSYLTSGRELLPRDPDLRPASSVMVLADPDLPRQRTSSRSAPRGSLLDQAWDRLPGTRQEARSIQRLLPQAQLFLGPEATRQRLLQPSTPGILHLATHGFFIKDTPTGQAGRGIGSSGEFGDTPEVRDLSPLLRSGLVLAGARVPAARASTAPPEAAPVTALELAGLDLWRTQLVVLSACDTGRGEIQVGQGVQGLRRALMVAGAETVILSLWSVEDASTHLLMRAYYRQLLAGHGRAAALREAMRSLRASHPEPHDWAPFIALGRDAPLRDIIPTVARR